MQNNWADLLLVTEYTYNDTSGAATKYSLFFVIYSEHPSPLFIIGHKPFKEVPAMLQFT